jgi:hypothetical protein
MNQIIEEGRAFANADGLKVSDMSANAPVGTTLAILERTLKVMSAVQARIYYAMKQEFKLLKGIIRDYTPSEYNYDPEVGDRRAKQADYDDVDVIPVSDPNAATMSQKVVQYQAVMQMAQANPQIYDMVELNKQMLEVLGVKNIAKLVPAAEDQKPKDPVSENMNLLNGKPVKAFIYQDHQAHIQVHMAAMQDPKIAAMIGQNPQAQNIQAATMAHINEHIAFEYRKQIEDTLGTPMPAPDQELPPEAEVQLSRLTAQAAQQLLQKNQGEQAQQQAQQQAQDPMVQMQQQELQLKGQELQLKAQTEQQKIQVEMMRIQSQEKIAGMNAGLKATMENQKLQADQHAKGVELGINATQKHIDKQHQKDQTQMQHQNNLQQTALQAALQGNQQQSKE